MCAGAAGGELNAEEGTSPEYEVKWVGRGGGYAVVKNKLIVGGMGGVDAS